MCPGWVHSALPCLTCTLSSLDCSQPPHPPRTSWGCGQPLPLLHPRLPWAGTSWWMSSLMAPLHSPAWGPLLRRPSSGTSCLCPTQSHPFRLPPVPRSGCHSGLCCPSYLAVFSHSCVSVHSSFSPSSCLSFPGPLAASLGLAACHTCLLCLLWDWMAQRAGAPCP